MSCARSSSVRSVSPQRDPAFRSPDNLYQLVFCDGIAGFAAENIVQTGLRAALIAQPQEILQRVGDFPAGEQIDGNVELVLSGHVGRIAIPLKNPAVDRV